MRQACKHQPGLMPRAMPRGWRVRPACMAVLALGLTLAGCASMVRVQPLATARADMPAYILTAESPQALAREASRLCPAGHQVLRQSQSGTRLAQADSRWQQAWQNTVALLDAPQSQAQLMVLCGAAGSAPQVAAATTGSAPAAAPAPAADATAAAAPAHRPAATAEGPSPAQAAAAPAPPPAPRATAAPPRRATSLPTAKAKPDEIDELDLAAQVGLKK